MRQFIETAMEKTNGGLFNQLLRALVLSSSISFPCGERFILVLASISTQLLSISYFCCGFSVLMFVVR